MEITVGDEFAHKCLAKQTTVDSLPSAQIAHESPIRHLSYLFCYKLHARLRFMELVADHLLLVYIHKGQSDVCIRHPHIKHGIERNALFLEIAAQYIHSVANGTD